MNHLKPQPPKSPSPGKAREGSKHWSNRVQETLLSSAGPDGLADLCILGGAENGQFPYISDIRQIPIVYHTASRLHQDDIILEVQGQKVGGNTLRDLIDWLRHVSKNGAPVMFKTVNAALLTKDLREYLNTRFQKGSLDHDLQQTIRNNIYRRTVPCTTRSPKKGEKTGVDYKFLSVEDFLALEKSGSLLESGFYDGNHYGTPKPPKEPSPPSDDANGVDSNLSPFKRTGSMGTLLPGQHPSSEGKRRRNRSNIETVPSKPRAPSPPQDNDGYIPQPFQRKKSLERAQSAGSLGPLPPNWEMSFTEDGTPYFIDHNSETTHWLDPRLSTSRKMSPLECNENDPRGLLSARSAPRMSRIPDNSELPYGWERVEDPHYGVYYIDHVNRKTQYENPVLQAKRLARDAGGGSGEGSLTGSLPRNKRLDRAVSNGQVNGRSSPPAYGTLRQFTKNPGELRGHFLTTHLVKSPRGFGFTIVGGDDSDAEEFLQIKSVVPDGPAYADGKLARGDVLVYVNEQCVLGYTHQEIVSLFQSIPINNTVRLQVCRGYLLPFDPDDPNTEVITTVAVTLPQTSLATHTPSISSSSSVSNMPVTSMGSSHGPSMGSSHGPSMGSSHGLNAKSLPNLADSQRNRPLETSDSGSLEQLIPTNVRSELLTVNIVKGALGFGFTIADSAYGQKVKQILDRERCGILAEGDILVEINSRRVKDMSHGEVVDVLKSCSRGDAARVTVQRGGLLTPSRGRKATKSPRTVQDVCKTPVENMYANLPASHSDDKVDKSDGQRDEEKVKVEVEGQVKVKSEDKEVEGHSDKVPPVGGTSSGGSGTSGSGLEVGHHPAHRSRTPDLHTNKPQPVLPLHPAHRDTDAGYRPPHMGPDYHPAQRGMPPPRGYPSPTRAEPPSGSYNETDRDWTDRNRAEDMSRIGGPSWDRGNEGRSRTPGPEFMRARDREDELAFKKPPSPSMVRSKTPTPYDMPRYNSNLSGTPDFIPASHYHTPASTSAHNQNHSLADSQPSTPYYAPSPQPQSAPLRPASPTKLNLPRKQSTSFENEEPSPSNLTRLPPGGPWEDSTTSGSLDRSPSRFSAEEGVKELTVRLRRHESGFGFRIIGGTEEGSQVSVGHIVAGGAAEVDGTLQPGDEILYVDNICVVGESHHRVVQLVGQAGSNGHVSLHVRRRPQPPANTDAGRTGNREPLPYDVKVTRLEHEGFGFVIISSITRAGSVIGKIIEGSPAERCGNLHIGDRILAVNSINILRRHHEEIVNIIKESGYSVTLTIGPPQDDVSSNTSQRSSQGSMVNATAFPSQTDTERNMPSDTATLFPATPRTPVPLDKYSGGQVDKSRGRVPPRPQAGEEERFYAVELHRGSRGFGFSIRGGREFGNMALFVLRIADGGAADLDRRLQVGDQLIEINSYNTTNMTHAEAIELIQNGGSTVRLLVKRAPGAAVKFAPHPQPGGSPQRSMPPAPQLTQYHNGPSSQSSPLPASHSFPQYGATSYTQAAARNPGYVSYQR